MPKTAKCFSASYSTKKQSYWAAFATQKEVELSGKKVIVESVAFLSSLEDLSDWVGQEFDLSDLEAVGLKFK